MTYNKLDTTRNDLLNVMKLTQPKYKPRPGYEAGFNPEELYGVPVDLDKVYPNLYIGDGSTAQNKTYLLKIGITHVLNAAEGKDFCMVDTCAAYYRDTKIQYLGLNLMDHPTTDISICFEETSQFIDNALKAGGKVYVHCLVGMSRSSTCVIAYLMMKRGMTAADALRTVRKHRGVCPNHGFLDQLADLDNKLRRDRERNKNSLCSV